MTRARLRAATGIAALLLAAAAAAAHAARPEPEPAEALARARATAPLAPPMGGRVDPAVYRLGPGDVLVVYVYGRAAETLPLPVGPDGSVFVPELGSIAVAGRTLAEVRDDLERRVASRFRGVRAEVRLEQVRRMLVYVTGEVVAPGPVEALGSSRVPDLLPDSLFRPAASRRNIVLRRRDGGETLVDLLRFQLTGRGLPEAALEDGDVLHVPARRHEAGVWGGVVRPGVYELGPADSLSTLLAIAGGPLPGALLDLARLVRDDAHAETLSVSLATLGAAGGDLPVRDGDQLYVSLDPEHGVVHQVTVAGLVVRAGHYPIEPGRTRLSDVIRVAGGFRDGADLSAIRLTREIPAGAERNAELERLSRLGRREMTDIEYERFRTQLAALRPEFRVDWARLLAGGRDADPVLVDGDIVQVDRIENSVRVDGQVLRPGVYPWEPGRGWRDYVELAGGFTTRGSRGRVLVTRSVNGQTVPARNVGPVQRGDFVWVPERADRTAWDHLRDLLAVGASVATVVIAFRR